MARTRQVGRRRLRTDRRHHGGGAIGGRNSGADVVLGVDGDAEGGAERRGVGIDRQRNLQLVEPLAGHRQTDLATPVPRHEVDRLGSDLLRRDRQVPFILAVLIVNDDDHPAGADLRERVVYRRKRAALARPFGDSNLRALGRHILVRLKADTTYSAFLVRLNADAMYSDRSVRLHADPNSCTARATYLPTTSHSRFTGLPAASEPRVVCARVNGMIMTSKWSGPRAATVRLTPSRATDPLGTKNGASPDGNATVSQRASPSTRTSRTVPSPSTCPWTKWPPNRPLAAIARSRFTGCPAVTVPRVVTRAVSGPMSAANPEASRRVTVRHTPFTDTLSPSVRSAAISACISIRRPFAVRAIWPTRPTASMRPVN